MIGLDYTMSDLIRAFRDNIKDHKPLNDWCVTNFGKSLKVGVGSEERQEWGLTDAPFVQIIPTGMNTGMASPQTSFEFDIDLGIDKEEIADSDYINVIEHTGVYLLDEFVNYITDVVLLMAQDYNAMADDIRVEFNSNNFYPLHIASLNVSVVADQLINGLNTLGG